ncbi:MAG TPA: hypothetical protein VJS45_08130, partial [Acidimicrobiia bacterium]|nr:hypothetical protein [Acidimicrobiia bacterium]
MLVALATGIFGVLLSGTAQAAVRCTYDPASKIALVVMTAEGDAATIARQPDGVIIVNGTPCGEATVANTTLINVEGGDLGTGERVTIDLANGGFPNVKFQITAFFELGVLTIEGTPKDDTISVGRGPLVNGVEKGGVDLDGDLKADITFCLFPEDCDTTGLFDSGITSIIVNGKEGNDRLTGAGGGTVDQLSGPILEEFVTLNGGPGRDILDLTHAPQFVEANLYAGYATGSLIVREIEDILGSRFSDDLTGDDKANEITGGPGEDIINGLSGDDLIEGHEGNDIITGELGDDLIHSGPGDDT